MKLHDVDLNKLSTFLAVAEAGGVGKAALRLGRTGSAVSQSLAALEARLDCKLFDRVGKVLVPTRGGQHLIARLSDYEALLARTLTELDASTPQVNGIIRLGLFLGFPRVRSRELLVAFAERFPSAGVRVVYAPQRDLEARLRKNHLDFVLSFRAKSADAPDLVSTRLFAQELVLVAHRRFFQRGFSVQELAAAPIVDYYPSDPLISRWLSHHFPAHKLEPNVRFWAATTDLVLELVQSGAGIGVLPRHMLSALPRGSSALAEGSRKVGPVGNPLVDHVWLNEPRDAYRDTTQKAFREVLLSVLARTEQKPRRNSRG